MVGNLVSGKRIAQASGRDLGQTDDNDQVKDTHSHCSYLQLYHFWNLYSYTLYIINIKYPHSSLSLPVF